MIKTEQQKRRARLNRTLQRRVSNMKRYRAEYCCEICGKHKSSCPLRKLEGAHIQKRTSDGSNDTIWNIIIACLDCHNHDKYKNGLIIKSKRAYTIVKIRNINYNIGEEGLPDRV